MNIAQCIIAANVFMIFFNITGLVLLIKTEIELPRWWIVAFAYGLLWLGVIFIFIVIFNHPASAG